MGVQPSQTTQQGAITTRERALAGMTLRLLLNWPKWIHRRTETVALTDPETIRRRVAVDFTLFADLPPLITDGAGEPIYFVPIALLKKVPLTNFDLRDERDGALPLLTRQRDGSLATAMLVVLAEASASKGLQASYGRQVPAELAVLLRRIATSDEASALSLCDSFASSSVTTAAARSWCQELSGDEQFMSFANALAANFVVVVPLIGLPGVRRIVKYSYEERFDEPAPQPPAWLRKVGRAVVGAARGRRVRPRPPNVRGLTIRQWLARGLGWRAKSVVIETPSVAQAGSYHLEIEAPDGLDLTHGDIKPHRGGRVLAGSEDSVDRTVQRLHLYVSGLPAGTDGAALANLRASPATIIRSAWLTAAFTIALLGMVALRWHGVVTNLAALPSLLLVVPTGLAAYVARPREPSVTTSVLFGLRLLAVSSGLWSFLAAAVLVIGRTCSTDGGQLQSCSSWSATPVLLWGFFALSALTFLALSVTYARTARPPEQE